MACLPESGQCERGRTDAFVTFLNVLEKRAYAHEICLDVVIRNKPQPETLYRDENDGSELVIERKNVLWPTDYAEYHHAEHYLFDQICARIGDSAQQGPYALAIPCRISVDRSWLREFADELAERILPRMDELRPGQSIRSRVGDHPFVFWCQCEGERDESEPQSGLVIEVGQRPSGDLNDPRSLPGELQQSIEGAFRSCVQKFAEYQCARCVLLIDPHGELRCVGEVWWHETLRRVAPPSEIDEIWLGMRGYLGESDEEWTFNRIHPSAG